MVLPSIDFGRDRFNVEMEKIYIGSPGLLVMAVNTLDKNRRVKRLRIKINVKYLIGSII